MGVGGIRRDPGSRQFTLGQTVGGQVFARSIAFLPFEQVAGSDDPRRTEVWCQVRSVAHHVVVPDVKVVLDVQPFLVGEEVAERGIALRDRLVPAQLSPLAQPFTRQIHIRGERRAPCATDHVHGENVLIVQVLDEVRHVRLQPGPYLWRVDAQPLVGRLQRRLLVERIARFLLESACEAMRDPGSRSRAE